MAESISSLRKKEGRGKLLTALLFIDAFFILKELWQTLSNQSGAFNYYGLLSVLIGAVIFVGLWKWQKIAVYVFFVYFVYVFIVSILWIPSLISHSSTERFIPNILGAGLAISVYILRGYLYFWAIKRKWHLFT